MRTKKTGTRSPVSACRLSCSCALAALHVVREMDVLEHQPGREGAHDRGEAGDSGEPREAEAEAERQRQHDALRAQREGAAEDAAATGSEPIDDRPDQECERLRHDQGDRRQAERRAPAPRPG